ncbi:MAG TPA: type VI secretion system contractile sheath small subunit [Polyangiaceae bacterium]|nr:type VI secretion system contractile sheath small subunit [Polyangiaceae bacterium]
MAITDEIPRSRITLTYRTTVRGEPEDVTLPFRVLIMGDLSAGTSTDRTQELDKRQIRRLDGKNLNQVMRDMRMSLRFNVKNRVNPKSSADEFEVVLPIDSTKSFQPAEVAKHVPRIRALLLLKKLLLEAQANFDNRKEFRGLLREIAQSSTSLADLVKELPGGFDTYKLPAAKLKLTVAPDIAKLDKLEVRRATLVPDPLGKAPGGELRKDEEIVPAAQFNQPVRIKPGKIEVRVFAPGKKPWSKTAVVEHDATIDLTVGPLEDA